MSLIIRSINHKSHKEWCTTCSPLATTKQNTQRNFEIRHIGFINCLKTCELFPDLKNNLNHYKNWINWKSYILPRLQQERRNDDDEGKKGKGMKHYVGRKWKRHIISLYFSMPFECIDCLIIIHLFAASCYTGPYTPCPLHLLSCWSICYQLY